MNQMQVTVSSQIKKNHLKILKSYPLLLKKWKIICQHTYGKLRIVRHFKKGESLYNLLVKYLNRYINMSKYIFSET